MPATVLVEGESDRLAVETLARRHGLDLAAADVRVVAMGGATNLGRFLRRLPDGERVLGLCDEAEAPYFLWTLERAGTGSGGLEERGFEVCRADLEDELVRALGTELVLEVVAARGEGESPTAAGPARRCRRGPERVTG